MLVHDLREGLINQNASQNNSRGDNSKPEKLFHHLGLTHGNVGVSVEGCVCAVAMEPLKEGGPLKEVENNGVYFSLWTVWTLPHKAAKTNLFCFLRSLNFLQFFHF